MLALLSALVHPTGFCAAKKLLKLHVNYDDKDAYNALSDLQSFEILLFLRAWFPAMDAQLCTGDRNLALLWVGAGIDDVERSGNGIRFSITPNQAILPDPYGARWSADVRSV